MSVWAPNLRFESRIDVEKPLLNAFNFSVDPAQAREISEHVSNHRAQTSDSYERTLRIHRQSVPQRVTIEIMFPETHVQTRTQLYGFDIQYDYYFEALSPERTRIRLVKRAAVQGFWRILNPLIGHLLTRPEHDGRHLETLKAAIEA
jgi:hypothetical protein